MIKKMLFATALGLMTMGASAQDSFLNKLKDKVTSTAKEKTTQSQNSVNQKSTTMETSTPNLVQGETYYVSATTGKGRGADGLSPETAFKDLQKAFDTAPDGATILIAEGNYLGNSDCGYMYFRNESNPSDPAKFFKIYGGYSTDFKTRDVNKYITKIQPTPAQTAIKRALLNIDCKRPFGYKGPEGEIVVDGITFEMGELALYCTPDVSDPRTGTPNDKVLSGRMLLIGESPSTGKMGYLSAEVYAIRLNTEGQVKIQNCTFVNCTNYAIQGSMGKGHLEISNNVFVACRMSACYVAGSTNDPANTSLDFHHNTVMFTWARTKTNESMGQGFRFTNGIRIMDCHHNIFGCHQHCAVERTFFESNKANEAAKQCNLHDNLFFANRADLEISNGASAAINIMAAKIEDVDEKTIGPKYENNREMDANEAFINAIDEPYLQGYMNATITTTSSYDPNSAANQVNRLFGMNQQGTETVRVSMFANKYPWMKAYNFFGLIPDYGAQQPK